MKEEKKKWVQPELTVLVRSKPEEGILVYCKWDTGDVGPQAINAGWPCAHETGCVGCASRTGS